VCEMMRKHSVENCVSQRFESGNMATGKYYLSLTDPK
jgi:hypothetical protein